MRDPSSNEADQGLWHRWRPWLIVSATVLGTVALLALALVVLPPLLIPGGRLGPPVPQAVPSVGPSASLPQPSPAATPLGYADVANALSATRGNLVAALGVLAVLIGAVVGFLNFRESQRQNLRSLELSRRGQVNERFSKAIGQLGESGDDKVDVRIGAIYSLEQIARDSPDELYGPIVETLTAFLRGHSHPEEEEPAQDSQQAGPPDAAAPPDDHMRQRADFQAIATVLGRRDRQRDTEPLDLTGVDLRRVILIDAHLERATLRGACLQRATIRDAHFETADLGAADLKGASLDRANLEWASLEGADLEGASLTRAQLRKADLRGANLGRVDLSEANLEKASLVGAHLEGARLADARLEGADARGANLTGAVLRRAHLEEAFLHGANLEAADLNDTHLEGAVLVGARLEGASLLHAHLEGAAFREEFAPGRHDATGLTLKRLAEAHRDESTLLPSYLQEPTSTDNPDP